MAVTTLDPNTALIVVDMQNAIVAMETVTPAQLAVQHAGELAAAFRSRDLPVVLVSAAGQPPGRIERPIRHDTPLPENPMALAAGLNQQPGDHLVVKRSRSAFAGTGLTQYLRDLGVTQVVLAGIATSIAVETSARYAYEDGFNVTLAVDAMTDLTAEAHEYSINQVFPQLGETGTTEQIRQLLP